MGALVHCPSLPSCAPGAPCSTQVLHAPPWVLPAPPNVLCALPGCSLLPLSGPPRLEPSGWAMIQAELGLPPFM